MLLHRSTPIVLAGRLDLAGEQLAAIKLCGIECEPCCDLSAAMSHPPAP